jgi:hypothetical protein
VSVISYDGLKRGDWPLTASLIIIGVFGTMFTASQYERLRRCKLRANEYRKALDDLLFEEAAGADRTARTLGGIIASADKGHREKFPLLRRAADRTSFWLLWPLTIALIGAAATAYVLSMPTDRSPAEAARPADRKEDAR